MIELSYPKVLCKSVLLPTKNVALSSLAFPFLMTMVRCVKQTNKGLNQHRNNKHSVNYSANS